MTIFYAKPDQTYREHLESSYSAWKETINAIKPFIERIAIKYGFSAERFIKGSLLTVALHDIGKMIESFQNMILAKKKNIHFNKNTNYRHELVSFIYTVKYWHILNNDNFLTATPIEALAVVSHHKSIDSDLSSFERESISSSPDIIIEGIKEAIAIAEELFLNEGWTITTNKDISIVENPFKSLAKLISTGILNKTLEKDDAEKIRILYSLLKGILHYADWHGSGNVSVNYSITKDADFIKYELSNRCKSKGIIFNGLRPFQEKCINHSGHLVAVAPTGSGKTEASIFWALKNLKEMKGAKILYLLPTMVTANSIWKRFVDFFGEENVGLTHSTANLFLLSESEENEEDKWENRRNLLFNKCFIKPVTVGTIDQLLTIGFNSGKWALKEVNALNSVIIIDEIHSYDGWTLGLIISTIRHFSSHGTRFMLMSATMPSPLQHLLKSELQESTVIREETLLKTKRNKYFVVDDFIEDNLSLIKKEVQNGKKVLVVVNTVGLCQYLSEQFSDLKPICYHSRFTFKDRKEKEKNIEKSKFVIATQVVEVSLDIDFDVLFTECAPPDAIVQRDGRVNRYRDPNRDSKVYIFKASPISEKKIYNPINYSDLLKCSFEAFRNAPSEMTEKDFIDLIEQVYKKYKIENTDSYNDALQQYKLSQTNRSFIFDSRIKEDKQEVTRQIKYVTVSVIPSLFKYKVLQLKPSERQWYEIKLPFWYVRHYKDPFKGITFCDVDYNNNIGATFLKNNDTSSLII